MRLVILCLPLIFSSATFCQPNGDSALQYALSNGHYSDVVICIESLKESFFNSKDYRSFFKNDTVISTVNFESNNDSSIIYRLILIRKYDDVIYYSLNKRNNDSIITSINTIYDNISFVGGTLRIKDETRRYVYGNRCGFTGEKTPYRIKLNQIVKARDYVELNKWLVSSRPELQAYAVEGLYLLKESGLKLSEKQMSLIRALKKDFSQINVCSGCIFSNDWLVSALAKFTF